MKKGWIVGAILLAGTGGAVVAAKHYLSQPADDGEKDPELVETYKGYDIFYWEGASNPYFVEWASGRQYYISLQSAKSTIDEYGVYD